MSQERIDFSSLDPSRNRDHWDGLVHAVAARAVRAQRNLSMAEQLLRWSRPTLAVASVIALFTWSGALAGESSQGASSATQWEAPSSRLARWAESSATQSTAQILQAFEDLQ